MNDEYEKLKILLFKDEMADLAAFRQLLENDDALAHKLSQVLTKASELTVQKNPKFQESFIPSQPDFYLNKLKQDPQGLTRLLTPIISPVIRSAVLQSMRRFITEVNRTLELGFSVKAIKWRWQAFRTGVPFSEIVFENTIQYQVQQLFLIDKETGLLVEHAGQEDQLNQDKEAMSAMLTAIQDFVSDSLTSESGTLSAAELGDDLLWVLPGAEYNLAVLIKGAPSGRLRSQLADLINNLQLKYGHELKDQNLWNNHLAVRHEMSEHLIQKDLQAEKKINFWPWILIFFSLIIWYSYVSYNKHNKLAQMHHQLSQISGLSVDQLSLKDNQFIVTGFKDPLAEISHLNNVTFNTEKFYSLDDDLVHQRAKQFINDPDITTQFQVGELILTGQSKITHDWNQLHLLPGIIKVTNNTQSMDLISRLKYFLNKNPLPFDLAVNIESNQVVVSGMVKATEWDAYFKLLSFEFDDLNTKEVIAVPSRSTLVSQINGAPLLMNNLSTLSQANKIHLQQIIDWNHQLSLFYEDDVLLLHANSDCQGSIEKSKKITNLD